MSHKLKLSVVGVCALAHMLLLFNSGQVLDGWYGLDFFERDDWSSADRLMLEVGKPVNSAIYRFFGMFDNIIAATNLVTYLCLALTGYVTYRLLLLAGFFSINYSVLAASLAALFPIVRTNTDLVVLIYLLNYLSFLTGLWLYLLNFQGKSNYRTILRLVCYMTFVFGFFMNSVLPLFYYLLFSHFLYVHLCSESTSKIPLFHSVKSYIAKSWDFLLLPLAFWYCRKTFTPTSGYYASYNSLQFKVEALELGLWRVLHNVFLETLRECLWNLPMKATILGLLLICYVFHKPINIQKSDLHKALATFAFAIGALVVSSLPYILVGQYTFLNYGWSSKNNILFQLPIAIAFACIFELVSKTSSTQRARRFRLIGGGLFLAACASATITNYLRWESTSAQALSLTRISARLQSAEAFSIVHLRPKLLTAKTFEPDQPPPIVWSAIIRRGKPEKPVFVVVRPPKNTTAYTLEQLEGEILETTVPYAYSEVDRNGGQVELVAQPLDSTHDWLSIAIASLQTKIAGDERRQLFLDSLLSVERTSLTPGK